MTLASRRLLVVSLSLGLSLLSLLALTLAAPGVSAGSIAQVASWQHTITASPPSPVVTNVVNVSTTAGDTVVVCAVVFNLGATPSGFSMGDSGGSNYVTEFTDSWADYLTAMACFVSLSARAATTITVVWDNNGGNMAVSTLFVDEFSGVAAISLVNHANTGISLVSSFQIPLAAGRAGEWVVGAGLESGGCGANLPNYTAVYAGMAAPYYRKNVVSGVYNYCFSGGDSMGPIPAAESGYQEWTTGTTGGFIAGGILLNPFKPATVTTVAATGIDLNTGTIRGNLTALGSEASVTVGFQWYTRGPNISDPKWTIATNISLGSRSSPALFSQVLLGLAIHTTYYFRAWANSSAGFSSGSVLSFRTLSYPPTPDPLPMASGFFWLILFLALLACGIAGAWVLRRDWL